MPRIRALKPDHWTDQDLAEQVSRDARLLLLGLWNLADEHARLRGDARYIKGQIFPYDDDLSPAAIDVLLDALDKAGRVVRYEVDGRAFMWLPHLGRDQRLEPKKVDSKLPAPPAPIGADHSPDSSAPSDVDESAPRANSSRPLSADKNALLYGTGNREQGRGSGADESAPSPEPPDRCDQHRNTQNPPRCGPCADARRERNRWEAERAKRIAAAPRCRLHRGQPADNCGVCRSEELSPA